MRYFVWLHDRHRLNRFICAFHVNLIVMVVLRWIEASCRDMVAGVKVAIDIDSCLMIVSHDINGISRTTAQLEQISVVHRISSQTYLSIMVRRNQSEAAAGTAPSPRTRRQMISRVFKHSASQVSAVVCGRCSRAA